MKMEVGNFVRLFKTKRGRDLNIGHIIELPNCWRIRVQLCNGQIWVVDQADAQVISKNEAIIAMLER